VPVYNKVVSMAIIIGCYLLREKLFHFMLKMIFMVLLISYFIS